jgi:chromate transporter
MNKVPVKEIFISFLKIGSFSFGGVYSMLSFFERELVENKKWITHEDFIEGVAIGQITPGPPIVNTGICIGYKLSRLKGAVAATLGQSFTGVAMAIFLAMFYVSTEDDRILRCVMKGIGAAVVGLLVSIVYKMGTKTLRDYRSIGFAVAAFIAMAYFKFNAIGIIIGSGVLGYLVYKSWRQA